MHSSKLGSRGFTLIASLMLLLIMSGVAIGLLMMVNTEAKVGGQDNQNTLAFHAAEGGIEHMTSDLASMFQNIESPTAAEIQALSALAPANTAYMSYPVYTLTPATNADGTLAANYGKIATGNYKDLYAQILPGHAASNSNHLPGWIRPGGRRSEHVAHGGSCADSRFPVRRVLRW